MLARTAAALAKPGRSSFAQFYKKVLPSITHTKHRSHMKVAGALWTITAPRFKTLDSPARLKAAVRLYEKDGNKVIVRANAMRAAAKTKKKSNKSAATRKGGSKAVGNRLKTSRERKASSKTPTTVGKNLSPSSSFTAYKKAVTSRSLSNAQIALLSAAFRATSGMPVKARVSAGRRVLADVRYATSGGSAANTKKKRKTKKTRGAAARRRHRRTRAQVRRRRAPKRAKPSKESRKPSRKPAAAMTPYTAFRRQVLARTKLASTKANSTRVQRLWNLTSGQKQLSLKHRVDMAVRFIRKSQSKTHKKVKARAAHKASRAKPPPRSHKATKKGKRSMRASSAKKTTKAMKASAGRQRGNPYLRFYRAMMLTGSVPNHPRIARTRKIKQLWASTRHVKTLRARINLGAALATGALPTPVQSKNVASAASGNARHSVKRTAKHSTKAKRQRTVPSRAVAVSPPPAPKRTPVKKTAAPAKAPIRFVIPEVYKKDPFTGAYVALHEYAEGATPSAKIHNVSKAWARSALPVGVADLRTPHQRIQAAADVLRRA